MKMQKLRVKKEKAAAPVDAAPPPMDFAAAAPEIPQIPILGGFGGMADGGRVHFAGGGGAAGGGIYGFVASEDPEYKVNESSMIASA